LGRDQGRSDAQKRIEHNFAGVSEVPFRASSSIEAGFTCA
jgi:hypothetical protein